MTKLLNFGRDQQGTSAYAPAFPDDIQSITLATGGAQSFTVPSNYANWIVAFSYASSAVVWVSVGHTAAPPSGGTFASSNSILLPAQLSLPAGSVVSVYNNGIASLDLGIVLYAVS